MPADIVPQAHDLVLKNLCQLFPGRSLHALGLATAPIESVAATALPEVSVRGHILDFLFVLRDKSYLHLEFQSGRADLVRFLVYDALLFQRDRRRIRTAVIYTGSASQAADSIDAGSLVYRVENVYLALRNGDALLDALRAKRRSSAGLTVDDGLDIALSVLMGHPHRTAFEAAEGALSLAAVLPEGSVRGQCVASVLGLAQRTLNDTRFAELLEVARMSNLLDNMLDETRARGRAEGRAEGQADAVLVTLHERFGELPAELTAQIRAQTDAGVLGHWLRLALRCESLSEFARSVSG